MERFRASRNQRFSSPPAMVGSRLGSLDNLCIPELGHYLVLSKFKSCFCPCNSSVRIIIIKSLAIVSWINVLETLFLLELKFYSVILLTFKCVHLIRDSLFFSVLKVETGLKNYIFARQQPKQSLNFLCMRRIEVLSVLQIRLLCIMLIGWCVLRRLFVKKKVGVTVIK